MIDRIRGHIERLLVAPGEELGRLGRFLRFQLDLWRFCARRLHQNNVAAMSAALSFRTIFALVPVIVLAFLVARSLGAVEDGKRAVRTALETAGFAQIVAFETATVATQPVTPPARVINVADEIESVVAQVEGKLTFEALGPIGGALFIWTALSLLTTMEESLNRVFGAPRSRAVARRVLLYWSAMTLFPIALGSAAYAGRVTISAFEGVPGVSWLMTAVGWTGPIVVGILVVAALYWLLPNTVVRLRPALGGAVVAVLLWLLAKWGFTLYVRHFVASGNLYGVLGVIPLFLLWLNFSWLIFLFGAQLAQTAANLERMRLAEQAERTAPGPSDVLAAMLAIAESFTAGRGLAAFDEIAARLNLPDELVRGLLDRLTGAGLVNEAGRAPRTRFALTRPPAQIAVREVLALSDPRGAAERPANVDGALWNAVADVSRRSAAALENLTLVDVLPSSGPLNRGR